MILRYDFVPIAYRPARFLSNSLRYTAWFFSSIDNSLSTSALSTVGCRRSAIGSKPLNFCLFRSPLACPPQLQRRRVTRHSPLPLTSFLPTLAQPSSKSFPCRSYENIGRWGPGPSNCSRAEWSHSTPLAHLRRWPLQRISSTSPQSPACPERSRRVARHRSLATRHFFSPRLPICRLRRCSPLRDTGTSASVASESGTRLRHDQSHR